MTFASEFRAALGASGDLKALVLEQIYPLTLPKGATFPAIAYTVITAIPQSDLDGHDKGLWINRVQVDVYGSNYDEAQAVALLVKAALQDPPSTTLKCLLESQSDLFEEQKRVPRVSMDFSVHWTET